MPIELISQSWQKERKMTMAAKFTVTPELLEQTASKLDTQKASYRNVYLKVQSEGNTLKSQMSGSANQSYLAQLQGFDDDFKRLEKLLTDYCTYLRSTAKKYRDADNQLANEAKQKLSTGR
jgi:WXG100 family type VII secretion target